MEARKSIFHPEAGERPSPAHVLLTHKSVRHDWQVVWKYPTRYDPKRSKRARSTSRWAVWVQT
jgi:hypothetical protein